MFNKISVIGMGYIGLPTAAMFASKGISVLGIDIKEEAVNLINEGKIHIIEAGLEEIVKNAVEAGHLSASLTAEASDAFLIAVPTPLRYNKTNIPEPDLDFIKSAAESIAPFLKRDNLVILESTSPVGATEILCDWLAEMRPDLTFPNSQNFLNPDINIAYCPERVLPGNVIYELENNDRVIGGMTEKCSARSKELYEIFVKGSCIITNARTAEMSKLTENSARDVQIAFANELSMICESEGINVWELISLANRHPRVNILEPGPGVGGHCIAVDPWFIVSRNIESSKLIHTARLVNDSKPEWVVKKFHEVIKSFKQDNPMVSKNDIKVACYGLAFKPDIDDLRESPSLEIAKKINSIHSGEVLCVEPNIEDNKSCKELNLTTFDYAKENAQVHLLLVDHKEFRSSKVSTKYLIDTKGIWL